MNDTVKNAIERIKKDKKLLIIMCLGLAGMILLLFSEVFSGKESTVTKSESDVETVEQQITERLEVLLKSVDGAGKVKVMVTLESLEERIVAVNTQSKRGEDTEDYSEEYVIIEQADNADGLTLKVITPVIRGVGIICEGASSSVVRQEITKLVGRTLGISANRIWVTKMQE